MSALNYPIPPVQQSERVSVIDVLRGFALFGILQVNMNIFSHPIQAVFFPVAPDLHWADHGAIWLVHFLAEGKFYALFSMLFGLGLTLQMERVEARGGNFVPLYLRRLFVLMGIGVVHAFLIWMGDILMLYASLGFLLVFFRKAKPRTLLVWVAILFAVPLLVTVTVTIFIESATFFPDYVVQLKEAFDQTTVSFQADVARAYQVYATGTFQEITEQRIHDYMSLGEGTYFVAGFSTSLVFNVMTMFVLGVYLGKQGIFRNLEAHRALFRKLLVWGLIIGLAGNALYASSVLSISRIEPTWTFLFSSLGQIVGGPILMLAYVSAFCLLACSPVWGKRIQVLAPVGQMALTNYLMQSIVCTLIFYEYGLGLYGKVGEAQGVGLALAIYLFQIPFSHWWLKNFKYGPAEWLWRTLTYGEFQPMKRY